MDQKGNRPLQEELHSSQVYRTLTGSGIPLAGKIAQGLGKAAQGIDQAIGNFSQPGNQGTGHPYRPSQPGNGTGQTQAPSQGTGGQAPQWRAPQGTPYQAQSNSRQQGTPPQNNGAQTGNGYYHYSYQTKGQAVPPQGYQPPRPQQPPRQAQPRQRQTQQAKARQPQPQQTRQTPPAYSQAPGTPQPPMKLVHTGSPAKFYITGAAAVIYALTAPLYEPVHFGIFALVLVLVFLVSGALFKGKKRFVPVEQEKPKEEPKKEPRKEPEKEEKSHTGNPEVDKIIDEGREYLRKLREADDAIPEETLSADIVRMERASADIFRYISDHPEKAPQIRKFMSYYLPTTLKLLGSYQRLSQQSVKGENITSTMFNIAGMMHTVADAFEKQLDALFTEEAMDISADITVFETLLKQEGFVEEETEPGNGNKT